MSKEELDTSASVDHQNNPSLIELRQEDLQFIINRVNESFHGDVMYPIYFEGQLEKSGVLSMIEDEGILPKVKNPNPFDLNLEEELSDQWWKEHPNEEREYQNSLEERYKTLRYILVGAILVNLESRFVYPHSRSS